MTYFKRELAKIAERHGLTVLVQALANDGAHAIASPERLPCLGITTLRGSGLVFTDSGAYADQLAMMQLLEELAAQSSSSART